MNKIKIINGVNLDMLGSRQPQVYGDQTLLKLQERLTSYCKARGVEVEFFQSNIEGEICSAITSSKDVGIVLNGGAYSHYSIAIRDAISSINLPVVSVHLSNIFAREEFRRKDVIAEVCVGSISGFGFKGYELAIEGLLCE